MRNALALCLQGPVTSVACESIAQWWPSYRALAARWPRPVELAIAAGFAADRAAWAFAGAYQACLKALIPGLAQERLAAFCVTEEGGNRPKDVRTRVDDDGAGGWVLNGAKRWAMLGPEDGWLLVAARLGTGDRPEIRIISVPTEAPGVRIVPMPPTRFVPEATHARLELENVRLPGSAMLAGDGHNRYVKPMRTLEDTLVTAALLAFLVREARARQWPREWLARAVAALAALSTVAEMPADDPVTHIALGGALDSAGTLFAQAREHWDAGPQDATAERWRRDSVLTGMAGPVRAQRLARAWERLAEPG